MQDSDLIPVVATGITSKAMLSEIRNKLGFTVPGEGRTVTSPTTYMYNNRVFNVKDFGAFGDGVTNDTTAIQNTINAAVAVGGATIFVPKGTYKVTTQLTLATGRVIGEGFGLTDIQFFGCHGFNVTGDNAYIIGLQLFSRAANGDVDPKLYDGITYAGSSGTHINFARCDDLYMRGWSRAIYAKYVWNSAWDKVQTLNSLKGFVTSGLSANNNLSNSWINGDTRAISLELNGTDHGEGLNISNTGIFGGAIGVYAEQFISLNIVGCTIDLCTDIGVTLTNCTGSIIGCWVYATNDAIRFEDLSSLTTGSFKVIGNPSIWSVSARCIYIGQFVQHVTVAHNTLQFSTFSVIVHSTAAYFIIEPNTTINGSGVVGRQSGGGTGISSIDADTSYTIPNTGFENSTVDFNIALAAGRTLTLPSNASSWIGRHFRIMRAGGAGTLTVQNATPTALKVLPAATPSFCDVEFGSVNGVLGWYLTGYGVL